MNGEPSVQRFPQHLAQRVRGLRRALQTLNLGWTGHCFVGRRSLAVACGGSVAHAHLDSTSDPLRRRPARAIARTRISPVELFPCRLEHAFSVLAPAPIQADGTRWPLRTLVDTH